MIIGSLVSLALANTYFLFPIETASLGIVLLSVFYLLRKNRRKICQFCGNALVHVNRPLRLDNEFLSMKGVKEGNFFYTKCVWGPVPLRKHWAKISKRSLACHKCRLIEEQTSKYYEAVSPEELKTISSKRY